MTSISKTDPTRPIAPARAVRTGGRPAVQAPAAPAPPARRAFDMRSDVIGRLQALGGAAPPTPEQVEQAFLESCVARSFGNAAPADPNFRLVIDQAREAIRSDAKLAAAMDRLVDEFKDRLAAPR